MQKCGANLSEVLQLKKVIKETNTKKDRNNDPERNTYRVAEKIAFACDATR
jgi:hypothetical protein